jgi:hypothetical protein
MRSSSSSLTFFSLLRPFSPCLCRNSWEVEDVGTERLHHTSMHAGFDVDVTPYANQYYAENPNALTEDAEMTALDLPQTPISPLAPRHPSPNGVAPPAPGDPPGGLDNLTLTPNKPPPRGDSKSARASQNIGMPVPTERSGERSPARSPGGSPRAVPRSSVIAFPHAASDE